jgi:uncharacterized membrane protein
MKSTGRLWAVGYDDLERAERARDEIVRLGWHKRYLLLDDVVVVVRHPDGSYTLNREPFPTAANLLVCSAVGFLAGLVVAAPLSGAAVGDLVGGAGAVMSKAVGISPDFVREAQALMKPGSAALFVLDDGGDMEVILHALRGLGGTVLRTNVDLEEARRAQSALAAASPAEGPQL